jgi:hypothetical protein
MPNCFVAMVNINGRDANVRSWHIVLSSLRRGILVRYQGRADSGKPVAREFYGFTAFAHGFFANYLLQCSTSNVR